MQIELESSTGRYKRQVIALDTLGCGDGERVLVVTGSVAARALNNSNTLVDAVVIASLDQDESLKKEAIQEQCL